MDRVQNSDQRRNAAGQRVILGRGASNNDQVQERAKQTSKSSHSKFNRILGNLERSILGQFNHSEKNLTDPSPKLKPATTSAKRKQIVHLSQQQTTVRDTAHKQVASSRQHEEHRLHEETARRQQPAKRDKITTTLKESVVKSASEKFGKLTLNNKSQSQESPRQPSSLCSSLATSRLSIPPPHANDEARSMNQTLLFGNGAMQMAQEHHQPLLDTANRPDISASSATMNATQSREGRSHHSNPVNSDRLLADRQFAVRLNSSPATSARSLPVTGPKPGSQHRELGGSNSKKSTTQADDEESGFATYQSRRDILQNFQQKQQQIESESNRKDNMILNRMNYYPNHQVMNQTHHPIRHNQVVTNHQQQNGMMMMPNNPYHRFNQAMTGQSNQVPIIPLKNSNSSFHQNGYTVNQRVPPPQNGYMFNQNQDQVLSYPLQQINFFDNHQLSQVQVMNEEQQTNDNGEQIYANAPPKPRRYQYYDGPANITATGQHVMTASQVMVQRPNANTSATNMMTTVLPNQQLVFNHQGQLCPQVQQPSMLRGSISSGEPQPSSLSNMRPFQQYSQNNPTYQQYRGLTQNNTQQLSGFQLMKSKSSLDTGDIMRFKQNRELQNQVVHNYQEHQTQPFSGYRQDEKRSHQTMNIHLPLNYSQNHRPPFLSVPLSNLQRSKSVTHLLPESNQDSGQNFAKLNYSDQSAFSGPKYLTSASTNFLNVIGMSHHGPMTNDVNRTQLINQKPVPNHQVPLQQPPNVGAGLGVERARQTQHRAPMPSTNNSMGANQFYRAKSMAAVNSDPAFSIRTIRHSPGNINVSQEGGGFRKPSLDDQIKHLLIDGLDNPTVPRASDADSGVGANNRETNAIYQSYNGNNRSLGVVSSRALTTSKRGTEVARPTAWRQNVHADQKHIDSPKRTQVTDATRLPAHTSVFDQIDSQLNVAQSIQHQVSLSSSNSSAKPNADMGNRQQRQYSLNDAKTQDDISNTARRQSDANSQLIVDLTTPRVLAKTQTTLLPPVGQSSDSCSINQVGLPQMSGNDQSVNTSSSHKTVQHFDGPSFITSVDSPTANKDSRIDDQQSAISNEDHVEDKISSLERSAPYYYSDLKSQEQREALRNIVQQKSLSPPPQLLSRSTDQSSTRLALRSATLHPGHARTLSDNLAQRQRTMNDIKSTAGSLSQSQMIESSSTSNIAKNIDKLFERPLSNKIPMTTPSAQSILSVVNNKESRDLSHISLDQVSRTANTESISSGYCSSDLRSQFISKSKSLDNISQKSSKEEGLLVKCSIDPVYENMRCSNKLLSAINDTGVGFSTGVVNNSANVKLMAAASTNSDESMDSILGSSLEDSDSCSDMIDEIKISSTDNHLHDISNLIEQLKTNQSKMADEYKSTLIRIAKTINSKQDDTKNREKLARRLQLLELKSKKCESRSKNQLALIQMMEKVLRQSKLRAMSNRSSVTSQKFNSPVASNNTTRLSSINGPKLEIKSNGHSDGAEHSKASKWTDSTSLKQTTTGDEQGHQKSAPDGGKLQLKATSPQNIIRAIVIEKDANSAVISKATVDHGASLAENKNASPSSETNGLRPIKNNAITKKILDIEARNSVDVNWNKKLDGRNNTNPFINNSHDDSDSSSELKKSVAKESGSPNRSDDDDDVSSHDDEDFIEYLSNDNSSHRSQFEASQFSASEFNASSTSASESSTSCGAVNDSLNSLTSPRKIQDCGSKQPGGSNSPITIGILKNRRCSYDGPSSPGNKQTRQGLATKIKDKDSTQIVSNEKFKNVLGNVVDVDICPMNNLSQGCSPVNSQAGTPCSN